MTELTPKSFHPAPPGSLLGVAWPASPSLLREVEPGAQVLCGFSYGIELREAQEGGPPYLAGEDQGRAGELTNLWENPDTAGIVAARGGYGCLRTAPYLDFPALAEARKPLVGFSDLTVFLSALLKAGLCSIHGPTLSSLSTQPPEYIQRLVDILSGDWAHTEPLAGTVLHDHGEVEGYLVGGNLTVLSHLVGTPWQPPTAGGIVFLEDTGEKLYRLDRALTHLLAAGFFSGCRGVLLGGFEGAEAGEVQEMAGERLAGLGVGLMAGLPFGHGQENAALLVGGRARLDPEEGLMRPLAGDG